MKNELRRWIFVKTAGFIDQSLDLSIQSAELGMRNEICALVYEAVEPLHLI